MKLKSQGRPKIYKTKLKSLHVTCREPLVKAITKEAKAQKKSRNKFILDSIFLQYPELKNVEI